MFKEDGLRVTDIKGNPRRVSKNYFKKNDVDMAQFYLDSYLDGLIEVSEHKGKKTVISRYPDGFTPYSDVWRYEPVDSRYFFKRFLNEPLYPVQQEVADAVFGDNPENFRKMGKKMFMLFWGKRAGKDSTLAKIYTYVAYLLACLDDPQEFLGMGKGSRIDLINICVGARQARTIFFKELVAQVKNCVETESGQNWFARNNFYFDIASGNFKYMDIREKEDIQTQVINFRRNISAHSLNGERFTGEGLNTLFGAIDEVGGFPVTRIFGDGDEVGMIDSLKTTIDGTSKYGALFCMSYKYNKNCAMSVLTRKYRNDENTFISKHSAFEVRPTLKKEQVAEFYAQNKAKAEMMFEVKDPEVDIDLFFENPRKLRNAIDEKEVRSKNPIEGYKTTVSDMNELREKLKPWFKGKKETPYFAHADLAKGKVKSGGDAASLVIAHCEEMRVRYDKAYLESLKKEKDIDVSDMDGELRNGVVIDLAVQIVADEDFGEVDISAIRNFVVFLRNVKGFEIEMATYDGWQSLESIQQFNKAGIESEAFSVDKNPVCYHTMKGLIYSNIFKFYNNPILLRELEELTDIDGKIDHPKLSNRRADEEGVPYGSKDVADSAAAVSYHLMKYVGDLNSYMFG